MLEDLARDGCAGLVLPMASAMDRPLPQRLRDLSDRVGVPLLFSAATAARWNLLHQAVLARRLAYSDERAAALHALVQQLPARLGDPSAMQRITDWLARALDVQVLVSGPRGPLAASPSAAAEHLAYDVIAQSVNGLAPGVSPGARVRLIPLAPTGTSEAVLAVAGRTDLDGAASELLQHAVKLLGLLVQAGREEPGTAAGSRAAFQAAAELLWDGEVAMARRVMDTLSPGLLDPDTAQVFVLDTPSAVREDAVSRCERATRGRALVVADPRSARRTFVIAPVGAGVEPPEAMARELGGIRGALGPGALLGGSGIYSLPLLADALHEALAAQRFAEHQRGLAVLSTQGTELLGLLPQQAAQEWARHLLRPLMAPAEQWEQVREILQVALAHPYAVAARLLGVHRNTVTRRVARAAELLGSDLTQVHQRIAVGLALDIVTHRVPPRPVPDDACAPTLASLLTSPEMEAWGHSVVRTARADRRNLLATATAWLACGTHVEPTARALGVSEVTVRAHLRALEGHVARDLTSLSGIRDLQFALYVTSRAQAQTQAYADVSSGAGTGAGEVPHPLLPLLPLLPGAYETRPPGRTRSGTPPLGGAAAAA
ncbi:helix-turn-helix domain-containing protein [Streptomyces crystallinus]|uniref:helix-turn-helix domain-containing protein n=1 Tax=Streptomyces crystallinus TaxID=68191 RepID=UPI0031DE2540